MAVLSKMEILSAKDLKQETTEVPEWGEKAQVILREATALERDDYQENLLRPKYLDDGKAPAKPELRPNFRNAKARLLVKCMIDERGDRLFSDQEAEDLGQKSGQVIDRLFRIVQRLSGMDLQGQKDLEKNSDDGQTESSPSNSLAT